jgi:hypothetical protein
MRFLAALILFVPELQWAQQTLILDRTQESATFHETRNYRIFLPPDYSSSRQRYPVIYWFHGYSERYNRGLAGQQYDQGGDYNGDNIAAFVATHRVIVVKLDGYNPRTPGEAYPRPYNIGPVETNRQFPLYFPEFIAFIDANYRTIADREHRATTGFSMGGFMSFWIAGKYPDLLSSASSFMGSTEFVVGPRDYPVEYRHDEMYANYAGVRTRLVTGSRDFIQFYHRQMNLIWLPVLATHETEDFDSGHGTPGIAKTLEFHMKSFVAPLPRPEKWSHADVYASFSVWGWTVETDRRRPGFTWLRNVSRNGFQSVVREWLPDGRVLRDVNIRIATARLYPPNARIQAGPRVLTADSEGRLHFELNGDENSIGIGVPASKPESETIAFPRATATDFQIADHRTFTVYQHAVEKQNLILGKGNGDGRANPGEEMAILFPDGGALRAAELFSADACADLTHRVSDYWGDYDHVGASAKYTLLRISLSCPSGHTMKLRARFLIPNKPNHEIRDVTIHLRVE